MDYYSGQNMAAINDDFYGIMEYNEMEWLDELESGEES